MLLLFEEFVEVKSKPQQLSCPQLVRVFKLSAQFVEPLDNVVVELLYELSRVVVNELYPKRLGLRIDHYHSEYLQALIEVLLDVLLNVLVHLLSQSRLVLAAGAQQLFCGIRAACLVAVRAVASRELLVSVRGCVLVSLVELQERQRRLDHLL